MLLLKWVVGYFPNLNMVKGKGINFFNMKYSKNKYRLHPIENHLSDILIITDSEMEPDYKVCLKSKSNIINPIDPLYLC